MRPDKNATILPMMVNASGPTTNIITIYIAEIGRMAGFFEKFCIKSLNKEKDFTPNPLNLNHIFSLQLQCAIDIKIELPVNLQHIVQLLDVVPKKKQLAII